MITHRTGEYTIRCDKCGIGVSNIGLFSLYKILDAAGWWRKGGMHLCAKCKARKAPELEDIT